MSKVYSFTPEEMASYLQKQQEWIVKCITISLEAAFKPTIKNILSRGADDDTSNSNPIQEERRGNEGTLFDNMDTFPCDKGGYYSIHATTVCINTLANNYNIPARMLRGIARTNNILIHGTENVRIAEWNEVAKKNGLKPYSKFGDPGVTLDMVSVQTLGKFYHTKNEIVKSFLDIAGVKICYSDKNNTKYVKIEDWNNAISNRQR